MRKTIHRTLFLVLLLLCGGLFLVTASAEEPESPSETVVTPSEGTGSKDPGSEGATAPTVTPSQEGQQSNGTTQQGETNQTGDDAQQSQAVSNGETTQQGGGDENQNGDDAQNGNDAQNSDNAQKDDGTQNSGDAQNGDGTQNSGDAQNGDGTQNSGDAQNGDGTQNSDNAQKDDGSQQDTDPAPAPAKTEEELEAERLVQEAKQAEEARQAAEDARLSGKVQADKDSDFYVSGAKESYFFDADTGVLYVHGDVTVSTRDVGTVQTIIADGNATLTLDGVTISAGKGPGILIKAPCAVDLVLAEGSKNTVTGANGTNINHVSGSFAGIEVEFIYKDGDSPANVMASLTIDGSGSLTVTGGPNAAGIGGSNSADGSLGKGLYGNITINGGVITAIAPGNGAGIGSSDNPGDGTSTGSYKKTGANTWGTITINDGVVNATSTGSGAGIGGGNHVDSGEIVINNGTIHATGQAGIGAGLGSSNYGEYLPDKGPGYYVATVTINGGTVFASTSGNNDGAGIGGGWYTDAIVTINGGNITASGSGRGTYHHGGAGIGAGYLGHAKIVINGGTVVANAGAGSAAAGIGSGGSPNGTDGTNTRGNSRRVAKTDDKFADRLHETTVLITGGDITAKAGNYGGAGIGGGTNCETVSVIIIGGIVRAEGSKSDSEKMRGGAGIGSGYYSAKIEAKYSATCDTSVSITGGTVVAIGGWGAAGVGSGADNKMADTITIDAANTDLQAYADGTKFAIDTRLVDPETGLTTSRTEGRTFTGDLLQGTFVHDGKIGGFYQKPEGLRSIIVANDATGAARELTLMPMGYRSFATDVAAPGVYTVYTDAASIGKGEGRYFSECAKDVYAENEILNAGVQYRAVTGALCDNFYLFPVKSMVVTKQVNTENGASLSDCNQTLHFALWIDAEDRYLEKADGTIWMEDIELVNGVPQSKAYFVDLPDKTYGVWEVNEDGSSPYGQTFGSLVLQRIDTAREANELFADDDNDGVISEDNWTDAVTVINTYAPVDVPDPEPAPVPDPTPTPGSAPDPKPDPKPKPDPAPVPDPAPDPEPDEPEIIDIPEENVPLAPQPEAVDIPDGDVPLASQPEVIVIPEAEVPLTDKPVKTVPAKTPAAPKTAVVPQPNGLVVIHDLEVPLASTPRTGDETANGLCAALAVSAALGLVVLVRGRKTEE